MNMKILGDPIFTRGADGALKSRIGTVFFRTPGLVTTRGIHAMQRMAWIGALNEERAAAGRPEMTEEEEAEELADSADLIFTDDLVLIRPDPDRMDLAFKADEALQTLVSKRKIRFLNTHDAKVRDALRARGENWRMARRPETPEDIVRKIRESHVSIRCARVYYYNGSTGTRWLTAGCWQEVEAMDADAFRDQIGEVVEGLRSRNRLGQCEIALFPPSIPPDIAESFRSIPVDELDDVELRSAVEDTMLKWRMAVPVALRDESVENLEWRNAMNRTLSRGPNETSAGDDELVQGVSPEFYRQIEWLPGGRVEGGELVFDALFDEAARTQDPELLDMCDSRVRSIIFNLVRLCGSVEYVNVGRITRSLARHPVAGHRRGSVYIVQYKGAADAESRVQVVRFQKWGVAEHLDEGKTLLQSILEADDYADYILDRRLGCRQLGMNLPHRIGFGQFPEKYRGANQYNGTTVRAYYYIRAYVKGIATDKVPPERFRNPAFARAFATLLGRAAALDLIVGRAATETGEAVFDTNFETLQCGPDGLPAAIVVTDHAGSFVKYRETCEELVGAYARAVVRRLKFVDDPDAFAAAYVAGFAQRLEEVQRAYRARRRAFDELFLHRPYDTAGSCAYRWSRILARLDGCDPAAVAAKLREAIDAAAGDRA